MHLYKFWEEQNKKEKEFPVIKFGGFVFLNITPRPSQRK